MREWHSQNPSRHRIRRGEKTQYFIPFFAVGDNNTLRQRAETFLQKTGQNIVDMPVQEVQKLVHELQVYQIELEMQNEELRRTQQELETSRDRYSVLYDFAPVGYVTLDCDGVILEANLTAAGLLGTVRGSLIRQRLTDFIVPADQDTFYLHRQQAATHTPQACELAMRRQDGTTFFVRLESLVERERAGLSNWLPRRRLSPGMAARYRLPTAEH